MTHTENISYRPLDGEDAATQVVNYYNNSPGYFDGPLDGACHFGLTPDNEKFDLKKAQHNMEKLLGEKLNLPPGSIVVDAGMGFGRVAKTLASEPLNLKIIGVDLIPERLSESNKYAAEHGVSKKVSAVNGNYRNLPIDGSSVDAVYTMETLVHADPLEGALSEFLRVLKPGGQLALFEYSVPEGSSLDPVRKIITDNMVKRTGMASVMRFTHGAFPTILKNAGFTNIKVEDVSRKVWPTWHWLFKQAIKEIVPSTLERRFFKETNLLASLMIWPYRHQLGYNVITANKPT